MIQIFSISNKILLISLESGTLILLSTIQRYFQKTQSSPHPPKNPFHTTQKYIYDVTYLNNKDIFKYKSRSTPAGVTVCILLYNSADYTN